MPKLSDKLRLHPRSALLDLVDALLEVLHRLLTQQQDPISQCQAQLTAFMRSRAPEFDGYQGLLVVNRWLRSIKRIFRTLKTAVEYYVSFAAHKFTGTAITWWETLGYTCIAQGID